jgi:hypothetical protein
MTTVRELITAYDTITAMDVLEKLVAEGFTLRMFPAYERHLGVEKYNCAALLEPTPEGRWRRFSLPGYLLDGHIALLVERRSGKLFVFKSKQLPAEGELLRDFERFCSELEAILRAQDPPQFA